MVSYPPDGAPSRMETHSGIGIRLAVYDQGRDGTLRVDLQILGVKVLSLLRQYLHYQQKKMLWTHLGKVDRHPFDIIGLVARFRESNLGHIRPTRLGKFVQLYE